MLALLKDKLFETLRAVAPLIAVVCVLQFTIVGASTTVFLQFLAGSALVTLGLVLLFAGVDIGLLPMGRFIGAALSEKKSGTTRKGRTELETLLDFLRKGDTLVVTRIDRLARSIADLQGIVATLREKSAALRT